MGGETIYIFPPDCWQERIPGGYHDAQQQQLVPVQNSPRGETGQVHVWISTWMEDHHGSYAGVNSERTIFMRREGVMNGMRVGRLWTT